MKNTKKRLSILLTIICLLAFSVTAFAKNEAVTISSAEATKTTVTVSGTTKALAVMVQVRDADDNILKMESFGTVSGEFTGKIEDLTLKEGTEYTVYVADYEGGDWTTATVKVPETTTEATTATTEATTATTEATTGATTQATTEASKTNPKAPQTGDTAPIMFIVSLMLLSALSLRIMIKRK